MHKIHSSAQHSLCDVTSGPEHWVWWWWWWWNSHDGLQNRRCFWANPRFQPAGRTVVQFISSSVWCSKQILFLLTKLSNISCSAPATSGFHLQSCYRSRTHTGSCTLKDTDTNSALKVRSVLFTILQSCLGFWITLTWHLPSADDL